MINRINKTGKPRPVPARVKEAFNRAGLIDAAAISEHYHTMLQGTDVEAGSPPQIFKVEQKKLSPVMCAALLTVYRMYYYGLIKTEFFSREDCLPEIMEALDDENKKLLESQFGDLYYFGLLEIPQQDGAAVENKFRMSNSAVQFCKLEVGLPLNVYVFQNEILGYMHIPTGMITDVLGEAGWDYEAILHGGDVPSQQEESEY